MKIIFNFTPKEHYTTIMLNKTAFKSIKMY